MAPATMTNSSSPAPTTMASDWTDFFNTVGTAAGPLLTLFGEQATKQFLSMSMGWADNILLAMGPIGIITIAVSAIRIGGLRLLKAIIGRSRESRASAEQEFLSSTSEEVCELWSGREVVRLMDKPKHIKYLVIRGSSHREMQLVDFLDAHQAYQEGLLIIQPKPPQDMSEDMLKKILLQTPNIALNVRGTILNAKELWFWALVSVLLQFFSLTFSALATYHWKWLRKGAAIPTYAYSCFLAGTIAMIIGLLACGNVIEGSTTEYTFQPSQGKGSRIQQILCLQLDGTVSSQHFPSFAILNSSETMTIRASHLDDQSQRHRCLSAFGSFLAITGFIVQFIGLGALHWFATIIVLGVSFIMMIIRAFVRRGLAKDPSCVSIPEKFELVWLALRSVRNDWKDVLTAADDNNHSIRSRDCDWGILTGLIQKDPVNGLYTWQPALLTAKRPKSGNTLKDSTGNETELEQLSKHEFILGFRGFHAQQSYEMHAIRRLTSIVPDIPRGKYADLASKVAAAMIGVMKIMNMGGNIVWKNKGCPPWLNHHWWVDVQQGLREQPLTFWIVDMGLIPGKATLTEQLTAGLSLWMYSLLCQKNSLDRLCNQNDLRNSNAAFLRIIASSDSFTAEQMKAWMPCTAHRAITSSNVEGLHVPGREPLSSWPVFGVYYSASFKMLDPMNAKTERTFTLRSAEGTKPQNIFIKTAPRESFEIECALEIFSLFMLSLCMSVDRVKGETDQIKKWPTEEMGPMTNSVFTALAQEVVDAGLENDTDLALQYIIPAFAKFRLLPKCRSNSVRAARERQIKKHQNAHVAATSNQRSN